jgi:hypothetical protein
MGPARTFPLAGDSIAVQFPLAKRASVMSRHDMESLSACTDFLTLSEHASNIIQQFSLSSDPGEVRDWLNGLAEGGAFVWFSDLLRLSASAIPPNEDSAGVDWLVIPTCNRPRSLIATVRSYVENCESHGRRPRLFVCDQSSLENGNSASSELGVLAGETGFDIHYAGHGQKHAFAEALCSDGSIPPETVRFALFGRADARANIGANRNATLLQTLGSLLVSVDDDDRTRRTDHAESEGAHSDAY